MSLHYPAGFLTASYDPLRIPDAPTIGAATAGSTQVSLAFSAPADIGGGAITSYTATSNTGISSSNTSSPIVITGLTDGVPYKFTVKATNAFGTGPSSAESAVAVPISPVIIQYLVVGGGGGGGAGFGGGGGAGGMLESTLTHATGTVYKVHVGNGGEAGVAGTNQGGTQGATGGVGSPGANSAFGSVVSFGGGFGTSEFYPPPPAGVGGSGGGGGYASGNGGAGTPGQGNSGGTHNGGPANGAGGGGAGGGGSSNGGAGRGTGGAGLASSITGSSVVYAGGGGGGEHSGGSNADAGGGGGGSGGYGVVGVSGTTNTGGGGGGGGHPGNPNNQKGGGAGGSGIVILKYPSTLNLHAGEGLTSSTSTSVPGYKITSFTEGFGNLELSTGTRDMEYLIVAGGGGGSGGGGGAGGVLTGKTIFSGSYTVTVGAGGALNGQTTAPASPGVNSSITGYIAIGGGFGAGVYAAVKGGPGGSGGGSSIGSYVQATVLGGAGTDGQGNMGGMAVVIAPYSVGWTAGGGGGAGAIGRSATNYDTGGPSTRAGAGGAGRSLSITGSAVTYGAGGQGYFNTYGQNGPANTGDGGYGSRTAQAGSNGWDGGSGVVVIAYPDTYPALTVGGGLTYNQPTRSGYRVYRFTAGTGTITF
jgi:hypothetical protein